MVVFLFQKKARNVKGAWEYIKFITSEERQYADLSKEGYLPSIKSIYEDPKVKEKFPYLELVAKQLTYPQAQWERTLRKEAELFDIFNNKTVKLAITGQKSVEDALREAEELYLKILGA